MPVRRLAEMTWEEVRDLDPRRVVPILPVGAVEAHGPHLPLGTDTIIAEAMARACGEALDGMGRSAFVMPAIAYTSAEFAQAFPGTVSVRGGTITALVEDVAESLAAQGFGTLAVANTHLDPGHLACLRAAAEGAPADLHIVFVDLTRRAAAERLTQEFRTGACHAGRYEGSVILAERPELVRRDIASALPPNPASLVEAIRAGKTSFIDAGGPRAYFGWPAEASAREGHETVEVLGALLAEAVMAAEGGP
jgi:creatinine amidohydrolase